MTSARISLAAGALAAWLGGCAAPQPQAAAAPDGAASPHQLLVMMRVAAPHFRPEINYGGSYGGRSADGARRRVAEALAGKYGLKVVDDWPMPALGLDCFVMEAPDSALLPGVLDALAGDPRVESAQRMQIFRVLAHDDPLYPLQPAAKAWHLSELHRLATGRRVRVAEIDSGVEADHPDLAGRVAAERNFVDDRASVAEAHGTAVAGIIAARADDAIGIAGVAPQSELLALRACWEPSPGEPAVCSTFTLAKALQFALEHKAEVINLSLGGPRDRLLERLLDVALESGIVVIAAVDPRAPDGGFPASVAGVLAVAGDDGHDAPAGALFAPGRDIPTTITAHKWGFVTGSSFAAAHMSGLVALLHELDPRLRPAEVRALLAPGAPGRGIDGIVDACAAVARTAGTCACGCALAHDDAVRTGR